MKPALAHLLVRLYPLVWRQRYGKEFVALLEAERGGVRTFLNVAGAALAERVVPTKVLNLSRNPNSFGSVVRHPCAFLPMAMSLTALVVVIGHLTLYGVAREADEGATAHIWQLLMAGQVPLLLIFSVKWLPRAPKQSLLVLALQVCAVLASMAPVAYFHL